MSGGRGGIVYHVTKLNSAIDDPERFDLGTLRYGLDNNNFPVGVARTIVFDVGGVFDLGRLPQPDVGWDPNGNGWDSQSRLTIGGTNVTFAGQTAPGAGVIFMGGGLKPQGNNNIIRNITVASGYGMRNWWKPGDPMPDQPPALPDPGDLGPGIFPDATVYDAMDISGTNLLIDHVSTLYATDESVSMNEVADNITVQYSNISQGQNYPQWDAEGGGFTGHALGSLLEAGSGAAISFHHNLYAHEKSRVPQMQGGGPAYYDFRNNVFYNWLGTAGSRSGDTYVNLVENFYLAGDGGDQPVGGNNTSITNQNGGTSVLSGSSRVYRQGNLLDTNKNGDAEDGSLVSGGAASPLWSGGVDTYAGTTDTAADAFDRVLDYMGANWWTRDGVIDTPDERIINDARTGTGKIVAWADDPWNNDPAEGVEWRALKNTPQADRAVDWDTEASVGYGVGDGMPTYWELQHGLDPNARDDTGDFDNDGYTNLEEYLNDIAAWPAPQPIVFGGATNSRYAQITNWDITWQPSRFDEAQINTGTVVVDAVGQHAGTLKIGSNPGDNATLNITGGWLKVEDAGAGLATGEVIIGADPAATATLNLSGGLLRTETLSKGAGGSFSFTGGVLSADEVEFDLVNNGGTISPGESPGQTHVVGDLTINSGAVHIELASLLDFDTILVDDTAMLGGNLSVAVMDSYEPSALDVFEILTADTLTGLFSNAATSVFAGAGSFDVTYTATSVLLSNFVPFEGLLGDYNEDNVVNAADYTVWRDAMTAGATGMPNDPTPDVVDESDFLNWRDHFGETAGSGSGQGLARVPEPASVVVVVMGWLFFVSFRRAQMR